MSDSSDPNAQTIPREDLVAYLDGELDDSSARRVEDRLRSDDAVRDEVQRLERAWNMLGELPRAEVDERLTKSTVEMLAVEAHEQLGQESLRRSRRRIWWWGGAAVGLLAAGFLGATAADALWPDPDHELLRDLPVVQNVDQYKQVDDLAFLKLLYEKGLFPKDVAQEHDPQQDDPKDDE